MDDKNTELEEAVNQYYEHAQFMLNEEDNNAIKTIIEALEENHLI